MFAPDNLGETMAGQADGSARCVFVRAADHRRMLYGFEQGQSSKFTDQKGRAIDLARSQLVRPGEPVRRGPCLTRQEFREMQSASARCGIM